VEESFVCLSVCLREIDKDIPVCREMVSMCLCVSKREREKVKSYQSHGITNSNPLRKKMELNPTTKSRKSKG